jgi:hypothetical protein
VPFLISSWLFTNHYFSTTEIVELVMLIIKILPPILFDPILNIRLEFLELIQIYIHTVFYHKNP